MSITNRSKKLHQKAQELGLKISNTQALELVSAEDGFNNRHVALKSEKSPVYSIIKSNQYLQNLEQSRKIQIELENYSEEDQLALLQMEGLKWNISNLNKPFINFYIETPVFSIYLGGIHSKKSDKKIKYTDKLTKDNHSLIIAALLLHPTTHKSFKFINPESFSIIQKLLKEKINKEINISKYMNLKDNHLNLDEYKNKKLYNFIIKEAKKQGYDCVVDLVLEDLDIPKNKRKEFFDHVSKYQSDNLWIMGECPYCGGSCGQNSYTSDYQDQEFTCQEMHNTFYGDEVENKPLYFSMRK